MIFNNLSFGYHQSTTYESVTRGLLQVVLLREPGDICWLSKKRIKKFMFFTSLSYGCHQSIIHDFGNRHQEPARMQCGPIWTIWNAIWSRLLLIFLLRHVCVWLTVHSIIMYCVGWSRLPKAVHQEAGVPDS